MPEYKTTTPCQSKYHEATTVNTSGGALLCSQQARVSLPLHAIIISCSEIQIWPTSRCSRSPTPKKLWSSTAVQVMHYSPEKTFLPFFHRQPCWRHCQLNKGITKPFLPCLLIGGISVLSKHKAAVRVLILHRGKYEVFNVKSKWCLLPNLCLLLFISQSHPISHYTLLTTVHRLILKDMTVTTTSCLGKNMAIKTSPVFHCCCGGGFSGNICRQRWGFWYKRSLNISKIFPVKCLSPVLTHINKLDMLIYCFLWRRLPHIVAVK